MEDFFSSGPNIFSNGTDPLLLLRELRALGRLGLEGDISEVPPLSDMNPECCYLAWDMLLTTSEPLDTIRDVFMFVEGESEIKIAPATESVRKLNSITGKAHPIRESLPVPQWSPASAFQRTNWISL